MVLEVGPGTGNMTVKLLEKAKKVRVGITNTCSQKSHQEKISWSILIV